jgi:hypothetical protein
VAALLTLARRRADLSARRRHHRTSITTSWQTIGRVAAVAVIRTFLNYFLERDVERQQQECAAVAPQLPSRPEGP